MVECWCVVVDKSEANRMIGYLLKGNLIRKDLKIRYDGKAVHIPVFPLARDNGIETHIGNFEERDMPEPPAERINRLLVSRGHNISFPDKFIKLGNALVLKENNSRLLTNEALSIVSSELNVKSIYLDSGIDSTPERGPDVRLLYGSGGDVIHEENGVRYIFDPCRVMFSPGNVNARIAESYENVDGKVVLDMFAGIGYFSLQIAHNSPQASIFSCEINKPSYDFLVRNIDFNSAGHTVKPIFGDCRNTTEGIVADYIVMGHFQSLKFLSTALRCSKEGTVINFHLVIPTDRLDSHWLEIQRSARDFGYVLDIREQKVVKSYGPHIWHVSTKMKVLRVIT